MGTASLLLLCVVGRKDESVYVKALCRLCDEITYGEVDDKMEKKIKENHILSVTPGSLYSST